MAQVIRGGQRAFYLHCLRVILILGSAFVVLGRENHFGRANEDSKRPIQVAQAGSAYRRDQTSEDELVCSVTLNDIMYEPNLMEKSFPSDEFFGCNLVENGEISYLFYTLDLPETIAELARETVLEGKDMFIAVRGGTLTLDSVVIPSPDDIRVIEDPFQGRRKLAASEGTLNVLMLRIIARDSEPDFSAEELYQLLFVDDDSMKGQYERCSFGKLVIAPIEGGVRDVSVNMNANGQSQTAIRNAGAEAAKGLGRSANLLMFVLPPGTGNWAAYATVNGKQSVFNNRWGGYLGAQLHEVGHNLGLRHAWDDGVEYGGTTGYMGSVPQQVNYPLQCYNGQNHWYLGWHGSRAFDLAPGNPIILKIAAFVDYSLTRADEYTVVKVNDLYLQYNRAKSFNRDTQEMADTLTIVEALEVGTDLVAGIDVSDGAIEVFDGKRDVVIQVCELTASTVFSADLMLVSVGYGDSLCEDTIPETPVSTPRPTSPPSQGPTFKPTVAPTFPPSGEASNMPSATVEPNSSPVEQPTTKVGDPPERSAPTQNSNQGQTDSPTQQDPPTNGGQPPQVTGVQNVQEPSGSKSSAAVISSMLLALLALLILVAILIRRYRRKKMDSTKSREDTTTVSSGSFRTMPSIEDLNNNGYTEEVFPGSEMLARSRDAFSLFAKATAEKFNQIDLFNPIPAGRVCTDDVSLCDPMDALGMVFPDPFPKEMPTNSIQNDESSVASSFPNHFRNDESTVTSSFATSWRNDDESSAASSSLDETSRPPTTFRITGIQLKRTAAFETDSEFYFR